MTILTWVILGFLAGWLASIIMKNGQGALTDIVLGVVGAIVGGVLMNLLGQPGISGFNFYSIMVATLGAIVLIWFGRILSTNDTSR